MGHYGNAICSIMAERNSMLVTANDSKVESKPKNGTPDESAVLQARIKELEAKLAEANKPKALTMKVSEKGAASLYGLGRFPVTLYYGQWKRVCDNVKDIAAWLEANKTKLAMKE